MNKQRSISLALLFIISILSFYSCKKEDTVEKKLFGTWELQKITFLESNISYPLDSFRNAFNVSLKLNEDFSFSETENIGRIILGPLNSPVIEDFATPRNAKARYLIDNRNTAFSTAHNPSKFAISNDSLSFYFKYSDLNSVTERKINRKFILKSDQELDIERYDILVYNKLDSFSAYYRMKFSYRKK